MSEGTRKSIPPRYGDLVEQSFGLMCTHDLKGVLTWVNPAIADLLGYERSEMVGRSLLEFVAEPEYFATYFDNLMEASEEQSWCEALTKSGESRFLQFHNVLMNGEDGEPYVLGHAQDITALIQSEQALGEAQERIERILTVTPNVIYTSEAKPDFATTYVSPNVEVQTGYPAESFYRRGFWLDKVHPDDVERILSGLERLLEVGENEHEYRFLHADGEYRRLRSVQRLVRDENDEPVAIAGQWSELSELELAGREIDRFFSVGLGLLSIRNDEGCFTRVNPAFSDVLGYTENEFLTRPVREFMHPDDVPTTEAILADLPLDGGRVEYEDRWRCADGSERILAWSAVRSSEGDSVYAIARDVTVERAHSAELRSATQIAEEANRAKGEFLAIMSHEIRTPMNGIIGMTELTLDTELSDQQREYLQTVHTSGRALLDVINEVLDFSKVEAGKVELEEIEFTLWENATGALKPLAFSAHTKGVELLYDEGPDLPERVCGDPGRLRQSLINLVGNAVKFTDEGVVQLTVRRVPSSDDEVRVHFEVRDTGIGIPADKLKHVFGSFNQVDSSVSRRFEGTGLGLSITSTIVEMMGGHLEVESEMGKGSTFSFTANFRPASPAETVPTTSEVSLTGLRGLVIDNHHANRHIVVQFAKGLGIQTVEAATAAEALTVLDAAHVEDRPLDLALFECHMPGTGGFDMAEEIRKDSRFENLVMLAFTAAGSPGDGARCEELGIASYLLRPVAPTELRAALQLTLGAASDAIDAGELVTRHSLREPRTSLNVLVAEDNSINQKLATHLLERFGHEVTVVENGEQALTALDRTDFDIVFMDIQMPIMDGLEATRRIREREAVDGSFTPIVAITAHAMAGDRERFLDAGMNEYISKPVSRDRLREVLRDIEREMGATESAVEATEGAVGDSPSGPNPESPQEAPPSSFNREIFLEHTESDPDLIRTLVEVFEVERAKHVADLEAALTDQNAEALANAAHTMKGALGVFGAESARKGAETLELLGRSGKIAGCGEQVEELKAAVLALEEDLRRFVEAL